jgi:hypothetical protein
MNFNKLSAAMQAHNEAERIERARVSQAERIEQARRAQAGESRPWQPPAGRLHARMGPVPGWKPFTPKQKAKNDKQARKGGHRAKATDALHRRAPGSFENGKRR